MVGIPPVIEAGIQEPLDAIDVCTRCAAMATSCCRCRPGEAELASILSPVEIQRILSAAPWSAKLDFFVSSPNTSEFRAVVEHLFPDHTGALCRCFPDNGAHYRLKVDADGKCVFLRPTGCPLPSPVRPLLCRIYPFWFNGPQLQVFQDEACLALREVHTIGQLCVAMGMTPAALRRLHLDLCQAWGLDHSIAH